MVIVAETCEMDEAGVSGTNSSIAESILAGAVGPSVGPGRGTCLMNLLIHCRKHCRSRPRPRPARRMRQVSREPTNPLQKAFSQGQWAEQWDQAEASVS